LHRARAFEPKAFYDLAIYLRKQLMHRIPQELKQALNRTCISRVYYAVFLSFREKMLELPIRDAELRERVERTTDAHAIVAGSVRNIDPGIGDYIVNLRSKRNLADYRTNIEVTLNDVDYAFKIANEVLGKLNVVIDRLKESDILSAWNILQKERGRQRRHLPFSAI
jgi:uncharacterized protein (UPF0332 family)